MFFFFLQLHVAPEVRQRFGALQAFRGTVLRRKGPSTALGRTALLGTVVASGVLVELRQLRQLRLLRLLGRLQFQSVLFRSRQASVAGRIAPLEVGWPVTGCSFPKGVLG